MSLKLNTHYHHHSMAVYINVSAKQLLHSDYTTKKCMGDLIHWFHSKQHKKNNKKHTFTHPRAKSTSIVQESTAVNKHNIKKWQKESKKKKFVVGRINLPHLDPFSR